MSDAVDSGHQNWYQRTGTPARPSPPMVVRIVAAVLIVLGVLSIVRIVATVALNLADSSWEPGARAVFLVLNAITLALSTVYLVLAYYLRRGRLWAWITAIVFLSLTVVLGGLVLLGELASNRAPFTGLIIVVPALAILFALTMSRAARQFFTHQRPFGQPGPVGR
jgi:hypothetical protein